MQCFLFPQTTFKITNEMATRSSEQADFALTSPFKSESSPSGWRGRAPSPLRDSLSQQSSRERGVPQPSPQLPGQQTCFPPSQSPERDPPHPGRFCASPFPRPGDRGSDRRPCPRDRRPGKAGRGHRGLFPGSSKGPRGKARPGLGRSPARAGGSRRGS